MSAQIKICGFTDPDTLRVADGLGVDWAGFNFVPASPRYVTAQAAQTLLLNIGSMLPVALLVDPDDASIDEIAALGFRILQLHGTETPERVEMIKARTGLQIWKAVGIAEAADLERARLYACADRLLLDARPPAQARYSGGHGVAFDWSLLENWVPDGNGTGEPDWMLAGGLTPETVGAAIRQTGASAVDVSSGVERVRGVKNAELISAFVAAVRQTCP